MGIDEQERMVFVMRSATRDKHSYMNVELFTGESVDHRAVVLFNVTNDQYISIVVLADGFREHDRMPKDAD